MKCTQVTVKSHQQALNDSVSVLSLIVNHFNVVQVSISPVHQPADQVQGDAMWEDDFTVHKLSAVLTIHVTALYPRSGAIISEEYFTVTEKQKFNNEVDFARASKMYNFRQLANESTCVSHGNELYLE